MGKSESRPVKKETYSKPELRKHGNLKDITSAAKTGSGSRGVKPANQ
jgi:hypothetical protein